MSNLAHLFTDLADETGVPYDDSRSAGASDFEMAPINCILMDDNLLDRKLIRRIAKKSKHKLNLVETGSINETRERLAHHQADILFADYRVPDGDGISFAGDVIRTGKNAPQVIVVTGEGDQRSTIEAIRAGAADYLPKGEITPELFDAAIENAMRARGRTTLPDDMKREQAIQELKALKKTSLKNTIDAKAEVLPLIALGWQVSQGKVLSAENRNDIAARIHRLAERIPALLDEIVIAAACGPVSQENEIADLTMIVDDVLAADALRALKDDVKIAFSKLPVLKVCPKRARFLIEALIGAAIQFSAVGKRPEISIGSAKDPKGNPILWVRDNGVPLEARKSLLGNQMVVLDTETKSGDPFIWSLCENLAKMLGANMKISTDSDDLITVMIRFDKSAIA